MRILHVSTRLILGGSQENTVLSCEGQARHGHEVHLAFGPIFGPEGSLLDRVRAFRSTDGAGIETHVVPDLVRQVDPARDLRCYWQLRRLVRRLRPDVVHTHSSKAGIVGRAAAWAERRHRPGLDLGIVHTVHGPPFMPVEGPLGRRLMIRAGNAVYGVAERYAARRCHVIVCVADAMTALYLSKRIGRREQYVTVHSGMETETFLSPAPGQDRRSIRASLGLDEDMFVIGTVARLAEHKGHDDVVDALADRLRERADWRLLWVGDGWWRARLEGRLRAEGLIDRVLITGLVPPERIPGLMRAMDVLCHPSYREGLPRTVPQALLCGTPVVAYDADGTREVCIDAIGSNTADATGRLVPVGDRAALRAAIIWMHDRPADRAILAEHGRARCAERFSAHLMVQRLDAVYRRAIAEEARA
ncbi:MAG: glycosyltransferase [Phycisphaerae bacterium]|nr:glycosyltransferase [Phycisphaerae bacterium]